MKSSNISWTIFKSTTLLTLNKIRRDQCNSMIVFDNLKVSTVGCSQKHKIKTSTASLIEKLKSTQMEVKFLGVQKEKLPIFMVANRIHFTLDNRAWWTQTRNLSWWIMTWMNSRILSGRIFLVARFKFQKSLMLMAKRKSPIRTLTSWDQFSSKSMKEISTPHGIKAEDPKSKAIREISQAKRNLPNSGSADPQMSCSSKSIELSTTPSIRSW